MKLLLLRHPETSAAPGLCYGRTDVPVPPEATRAVAERVAPGLPAGIVFATSPLQRCAGLAQALSALRPDLQPRVDARLAEMDFGAWEDRPWAAIARAEFDAWMRDFADMQAGGSGESTRAFMRRVGEALDAWREAGRDALWVTHGGVIRAAWLWREGVRVVAQGDQWPARPVGFGECVTIEVEPRARPAT